MSEKKEHNKLIVFIKDILFFVFAFVVIISFVFSSSQVNQTSMEDSFFEGERLIELKLTYFFTDPDKGDIIIFAKEPYKKNVFSIMYQSVKYLYESRTGKFENMRLIKRVIGVPGDEIDIRDGFVYVNGEKLDEPYVKGTTNGNSMTFPAVVPEGKYFVMGDNRQSSHDSRASDIGFIDKKTQIEGKIILRTWPLKKFGTVY